MNVPKIEVLGPAGPAEIIDGLTRLERDPTIRDRGARFVALRNAIRNLDPREQQEPLAVLNGIIGRARAEMERIKTMAYSSKRATLNTTQEQERRRKQRERREARP